MVRGGPGLQVWFPRLFILPHMCVGMWLLAWLALPLLLALFGADGTARVTEGSTRRQKNGTPLFSVSYRYTEDGEELEGSGFVGADTYARVSAPAEIQAGRAFVPVRT